MPWGRIDIRPMIGWTKIVDPVISLGVDPHGQAAIMKQITAFTSILSFLVSIPATGFGVTAALAAAETVVIGPRTPWRVHFVVGRNIYRGQDKNQLMITHGNGGRVPYDADMKRFSPMPPKSWTQTRFDDACWARYTPDDLADFLGDCAASAEDWLRGTWPVRIALRTCFGVADPASVKNLTLKVVFVGGAVVYVNGQEVGRGFMPDGETEPFTPARDYPLETYTTEDGETPLPASKHGKPPDQKWASRYQKRIRTITVNVPSRVLVKGRNVIAIALHRAPMAGPVGKRGGWNHVGVREMKLTSASGRGVIAYAAATKGTHVWSANAVDQVTETLPVKSLIKRNWFWTMYWGRGMPVRGVQQGNPFDPVLPVKITMPRNGVGSGQTVLSDAGGLRGVTATLDPLKGPGGAVLPVGGVQIRYAVQQEGVVHYCDALMKKPRDGAKTVPVWLVIQAPKQQPPGWYVSTLKLAANGKTFAVPVQVLVTGLTLPDAKDFASTVGMTQSPDTIARQYGVPLWSDAHFRLFEPSFALLAQLGNDVIHVPIITSKLGAAGGKTRFRFAWAPMIRWVKRPQGLQPDLSILEKYLDAYTKHCAPPRAISLYIWGESSAKETAQGYENRRIPTRANVKYSPPKVQVWDPQTKTASEHQAPVIGDAGSEKFWKPMLDGVRALVVKRGWSERIIALGLGGDVRPGEKTVNLLKAWAPYARWNYLSHFTGDPGPNKEGKMIATGGAEIAMMECPDKALGGRGRQLLDRFEDQMQNPFDFLYLPTDRWRHQEYSPPLIFRTMEAGPCCIGRLGLDFWKARQRGPKSTTFFSHVESLTFPGPAGAEPTVRFQMFRENVQDWEIKRMMVAAYLKLPEAQREPYRQLLVELHYRISWGSPMYFSQYELSYDWPSYVARLHQAAAELAGVKTQAKWDQPPE